MTTRYGILGWITLLSLVGSAQTSRASDFDTLLRAIPGDLPATIVVKNLSEFDAHVLRIVAHFDPRKARAGFVARLKAKLPFGNAVDLTKPVALCQVSTDNANETLMFVVVPNFEKKIERFESAMTRCSFVRAARSWSPRRRARRWPHSTPRRHP